MSGGSFDYFFNRVEETYVGKMEDEELNDLMKDLVEILYQLEWFTSGDTNEKDYREAVSKFKEKWFNGNREERYQNYLQEYCDKLKKEFEDGNRRK